MEKPLDMEELGLSPKARQWIARRNDENHARQQPEASGKGTAGPSEPPAVPARGGKSLSGQDSLAAEPGTFHHLIPPASAAIIIDCLSLPYPALPEEQDGSESGILLWSMLTDLWAYPRCTYVLEADHRIIVFLHSPERPGRTKSPCHDCAGLLAQKLIQICPVSSFPLARL